MQRLPVLPTAPRSTRPAFLSAPKCAQRSSAKVSAAQQQQRDTPVAQRLQNAGAALALSAALVLGPVPCALADLNKYEAAAGGEFGNGTALQFGEVCACAECSTSQAAPACTSSPPDFHLYSEGLWVLQASIPGRDFSDQAWSTATPLATPSIT